MIISKLGVSIEQTQPNNELTHSPFRFELRCPYSLLRSIAMTACGMAVHTAITTVISSNGCGAIATLTIALPGSNSGRRWLATTTWSLRYLYKSASMFTSWRRAYALQTFAQTPTIRFQIDIRRVSWDTDTKALKITYELNILSIIYTI